MERCDYVLVGGGLQNSLIALALLHRDPDVRLTLIEQSDQLGGNHTWSFHATDIPERALPWFEPIVSCRWPSYRVLFPGRSHDVEIGYGAIASERLHRVVSQKLESAPNVELLFDTTVARVRPREVALSDGTVRSARLVVDSRGPGQPMPKAGWQKFIGWEVEMETPLDDLRPIVMDACLPQIDGFRFLYVLPYTPTRCLVEETYFSDSPLLDEWAVHPRIDDYIASRGWRYREILRTESGVLPMPWKGDPPSEWVEGLVRGGYQGGWFHPSTCYSVPIVTRLAQTLADGHPSGPTRARFEAFRRPYVRQLSFARMLNFLMFCFFPPEERWHIFDRFYGLPADVVARFFRLEMSYADRARVLCGRPPAGFSIRHFLRHGPR